jgi:precorrin-6Y C5,15-methyltransferase (decarboxylating)
MTAWLTIIGIGEDGLDGLGREARQALHEAEVVFGGKRHLGFLPAEMTAKRIAWPSPFSAAEQLLLAERGKRVCVLASGDPMFYGVGATITRWVQPMELRILPAPSSYAIAAARLAWPLQETALLSVHGRPLETLHAALYPGARLLILSNDGTSPAAIAQLLCGRGFDQSEITVLEHLGGPDEQRHDSLACAWTLERTADLNIVAVTCRAETRTDGTKARSYSTLAGLPDEAFETDGQLTKRDVRAVTLAHLAPLPGEILWDVGAGSGSIGIEWMRSHPTCRSISIEADPGRQEMIRRNAANLGVPGLKLVAGEAPAALNGLETPDAIFIGGGVTDQGVLQHCWEALRPGGRLVANAVTLQSEMLLITWRERIGGTLTRLTVEQAKPLGSFDTWRGALPVTILSVVKGR